MELNEQVLRLHEQLAPLPASHEGLQYQAMKSPSAPSPTEEWLLEQNQDDIYTALCKSKTDYEWVHAMEEEEFQRLLEQACKESLELSLSDKSGEKAQSESDPGTLLPSAVSSQAQEPSTSSLPTLTASSSSLKGSEQVDAHCELAATACSSGTGTEAAAKWIESAKQEVASLPFPATAATTTSTSKVVSLLLLKQTSTHY